MTRPSSTGHVLVVLENLAYPADTRVRAEVEALVGAGYAVTVVGPTGQGWEQLDETLDGVRVLRFRAPPGGRSPLGYLREYGLAFLALARLVWRVQRASPVDLAFVCNTPDVLVALALPLKRAGAKVLFDLRELTPELFEAKFGEWRPVHAPLRKLMLWGERFAFRHADAAITVSVPFAEMACARGGADPDRLFIVGNGPDPRRVYPVEPQPELCRGRKHLVLWLGAMSQQEGLGRLIDAAEELVHGLGRDDVAFSLVGPGDVHDVLRDDVLRRGLEDVVEVRDAVRDDLVRAYMSTADVCVGVDEPNGMNSRTAMRKILEYMAMGRPIVQFPLAETQRLCGDAAVYAQEGDTGDLARKIAALLDDPERRYELGEAARRRAADRGLLWPAQVSSLLEAVNAALDRRVPAVASTRT